MEDNVITVATDNNAVAHQTCGAVKVFNIQKTTGVLLPGYDTATQRHDPELTTDVEDVLIGI